MGDTLKNKMTIAVSALAALCFVFAIGSCSQATRQKSAREKEMAQRLDAEERLSVFNREKVALEERIAALQKELQAQKDSFEQAKAETAQEQSVNESLKLEIEKLNRLKTTLESNLKEALMDAPVK